MSNFIKVRSLDSIHKFHYVNMDLVLEIVPSTTEGCSARIIFNILDKDSDYMFVDVVETAEEILSKI